jgi:hypothetical protein
MDIEDSKMGQKIFQYQGLVRQMMFNNFIWCYYFHKGILGFIIQFFLMLI